MDDCEIWPGEIFQQTGYGKASAAQRRVSGQVLAHRHIWVMERGPIPDGLLVCHSCDNRPCVRLTHLFLGTHSDNMRDMARKGRHNSTLYANLQRGPKITPDQVREIRARYVPEVHQPSNAAELAKEFGITKQAIKNVATGVTWKRVV